MAITLPGPSYPGRPRKPKAPKVYIPASIRALSRKGYAARRYYQAHPASAAKAATPKAPAPAPVVPPGSYPEYAAYPWAQQELRQIDADQRTHQGYVTNQVAPWLSGALAAITGTDPSNPGLGPVLQQQYLANVKNIVGGSYGAVAAATPFLPQSTTPGGVVAAPNAYLGEAARQGARDTSAASVQAAEIQARLNTIIPNTQAQGYLYALADYAKGLPAVYAAKRADARSKIDQFIMNYEQAAAQAAESARHNRVTEAISAQNAQTNAAISLASLGLKADNQAFGQSQDLAAGSAPAPYGYNRDPATGKLVRDPSIPTASSARRGGGGSQYAGGGTSTRDAKGRLRDPLSAGYIGGWTVKPKKLPAGAKSGFVQGANGKWYIKVANPANPNQATGSSGSTKPPKSAFSLGESLLKTWQGGSGTGGVSLRFTDPNHAAEWLAAWVNDHRTEFSGPNGKVNVAKIRSVLAHGVGGATLPPLVLQQLQHYINTATNTWR